MDYTNGFTGTEIVARVTSYIGNKSGKFKTFVEETLPLAESRFCSLYPWSFLHKIGLTLNVVNGTSEYTLDAGTIGFIMSATNVETIYSPDKSIVLGNVSVDQIRRYDPEVDDGNSTDTPSAWARSGDNKILIWPPNFANTSLRLDGFISPPDTNRALTTLSNYPTIPFRYQESFIEYVTAIALDHEDDTRADSKKASALALIKADFDFDLRNLGQTLNDRMRSMNEINDGGQLANLDAILWRF